MKKRRIIIIYILAIILLSLIVYGIPKLTKAVTRTEIAEYGTLNDISNIECFAVRNEKVFLASQGGETDYKVKEGVKIRKSTRVVSVSGNSPDGNADDKYKKVLDMLGSSAQGTTDFRATFTGVVGYNIDGYEGKFNLKNIDKYTYSDFADIGEEVYNLKGKKILRNQPVYKLCQNNYWYLVSWVEKDVAGSFEKGSEVTIKMDLGSVTATVESKKKEEGKYKIVLKTNMYYKEFTTVRRVEAEITTASVSGIIVDRSAITEEKGVKGVYVIAPSGNEIFTPVNILLEVEDKAVLSVSEFYNKKGNPVSTINVYDEILKSP